MKSLRISLAFHYGNMLAYRIELFDLWMVPPEKSVRKDGFFNEVAPIGANEEMKTHLRC